MQSFFSHTLSSAFIREKPKIYSKKSVAYSCHVRLLSTMCLEVPSTLQRKKFTEFSPVLCFITVLFLIHLCAVSCNFISHKFQNHWNIHSTYYEKMLVYSRFITVCHMLLETLHLNFNIFSYFALYNMQIVGHSKSPTKNEEMGEPKEIVLIHK